MRSSQLEERGLDVSLGYLRRGATVEPIARGIRGAVSGEREQVRGEAADSAVLEFVRVAAEGSYSDIEHFTEKHGPLFGFEDSNGSFEFTYERWLTKAKQILGTNADQQSDLDPSDAIVAYQANIVTITDLELAPFLTIRIRTADGRFRSCRRCRKGFLAEDRRQRHCCRECSREAQKASKRNWWAKKNPGRQKEA